MELAAKNIELTQRLATVEAETPTPQQVFLPTVIDTRLLKQPAAMDGDRAKWADWAFTFRAYASAVRTRMVVLMEHAQSAADWLELPTSPSDNQVNAQLHSVLAMIVIDGAMKKARNALVCKNREIWSLLCEEYQPRQRRRLQAMLSTTLNVQLRESLGESLDSFLKQVHAYEDQSGKTSLDEILGATVFAGMDNATLAALGTE